MFDYGTFEPADLPALVDYWNRAFADRRNFFRITTADFRERVTENPAGFDPERLFLAMRSGRIVGLAHARRALEGDPPDTPGRIAILHVDPEARGRGAGSTLLALARESLAGSAAVALDGQCFSPWYGNVQGPFPPFWGTPEGIGIDMADAPTIGFFVRRAFPVRYEAISMEIELVARPTAAPLSSPAFTEESYRRYENACPRVGGAPDSLVPFVRAAPHVAWAKITEGVVAGTLLAYDMTRARAGLWGIYELEVAPPHQGKGIGGTLVSRMLATLADRGVERCEVLTIPELSPAARAVYARAGFAIVARWAVF